MYMEFVYATLLRILNIFTVAYFRAHRNSFHREIGYGLCDDLSNVKHMLHLFYHKVL